MRLLLTSAGITNRLIANALVSMVGKDARDIKVAFIPTAANVEEGDKQPGSFASMRTCAKQALIGLI